MAECDRCTRCVSACPTGAIPGDRFLLRAERCLTHWNEKPPDVPFPEWISPEAHDALIGCMRCQRVCPLNRDVLKYRTSGPRFSESETRTLLEASVPDELGEELAAKLKAWDFLAWAELLPRNLGALLRGE